MKPIIDLYKDFVIQIATPFSVGTGFYLVEKNIIVTNEHVVRNNKSVVVDGKGFKRAMFPVIYLDEKFDLAFIQGPGNPYHYKIELGDSDALTEGNSVVAAGHPFGLKFSATQGIVSNTRHMQGDIHYIQHDAALNPGNSGGPLINDQAQIVGVNTFILREGHSLGFALPSNILKTTLEEFLNKKSRPSVRCTSCLDIIEESSLKQNYCPNCGSQLNLISSIDEYQASGIRKNLEDILRTNHIEVELCRRGPYNWEISEGSAKILLAYHEESGMIIAESILAKLPKEKILPIYKWLMQQNFEMRGLSLGINKNSIMLTTIMYDQFLKPEFAAKILDDLFKKANEFDDLLIRQFGALPNDK
ncbi:MAG: trypsin-like peptidase domain-containing protein [Saprospiraceae bacterium]|nr:trypsin-like peptidase domain-containing protein [Saprospiraceae bacterium]